jgi:hypothetical protein
MGLRTWLGLRQKRPKSVPHRYPDISDEAALTAHMLPERPSFTDYLHRRFNRREQNSPYFDKLATADYVRSLGLKHPDTYAVLSNPRDLEPSRFPDRLVVKPTGFCSTKGVMLLRTQQDGKFFEMMRQSTIDIDTIRAELTELQNRQAGKPKIIVEELITDERNSDIIPFDYKCYTFNGTVRFIVQVDRNVKPIAISFFRDNFYPIEFDPYIEPRLGKAQRGRHRKPDCWRDILEVARQVSKALKTPFISVDTYASTKGPVVGELTHTPGGPYHGMWRFLPFFDRELGDAWAEAERELGGMNSVRTG